MRQGRPAETPEGCQFGEKPPPRNQVENPGIPTGASEVAPGDKREWKKKGGNRKGKPGNINNNSTQINHVNTSSHRIPEQGRESLLRGSKVRPSDAGAGQKTSEGGLSRTRVMMTLLSVELNHW